MPQTHAERLERRRVTRIKRKAVERKDLFILDYIRHKYPVIYDEGTRICEQLNSRYPDKFDLRRTEEHRTWKKNPHQPLYAINHPTNIPSNTEIIVTLRSTCPEETTEQQTITEETTEQQTITEETTEQQTMTEPPTIRRLPLVDNMQLAIPLMKAPTKRATATLQKESTVHTGVTTETLQTVTDETLQEGSTITLDEIDRETIDKIIKELQADPDLLDTFNDMEEQLEFQELGLDLEIPEDNLLENWLCW